MRVVGCVKLVKTNKNVMQNQWDYVSGEKLETHVTEEYVQR